jgi:hypothetical protein
MIFPHKSRTRYIAHNPTGKLMWIITKYIKTKINKSYEFNSRKNPSKLD